MIAASAAASVRTNEAASSAIVNEAMATIPAASASMPSIRLTRFASADDPEHGQRVGDPAEVEGPDQRDRDDVDREVEADDRDQRHRLTPSSLTLGRMPTVSSIRPSTATRKVPISSAR